MRFQRAILESNQEKYLATQRTESIRIKQASVADLARVGHTLSRPWLRPFVEENNSSTVDNVGLNPSNVQELLNLRYPDHIMVRGPPYLQRWRKTPINIWVEKERPKSLIQPKANPNTCIDRWSLWWARQREQRLPSIQSKQYMLHSLLWESACNLHWTKNLVRKSGRSQGGHMLSSSGPPAPWLKNCKKPDQTQKKKNEEGNNNNINNIWNETLVTMILLFLGLKVDSWSIASLRIEKIKGSGCVFLDRLGVSREWEKRRGYSNSRCFRGIGAVSPIGCLLGVFFPTF